MVFIKIHAALAIISTPLAKKLPDIFLGFDGSQILAVLLLLIICFIGGLIFRSSSVKQLIGKLEDNVLSHIPGYSMMKSMTAGAVGKENEDTLKPVIVQDGDTWNIGFMAEEADGFCSVFFPEAPLCNSGELKIVPASSVKKIDLPVNKVALSIKNFGKGSIEWVKKD
jgi:uncharacterized membrane protein